MSSLEKLCLDTSFSVNQWNKIANFETNPPGSKAVPTPAHYPLHVRGRTKTQC